MAIGPEEDCILSVPVTVDEHHTANSPGSFSQRQGLEWVYGPPMTIDSPAKKVLAERERHNPDGVTQIKNL
jgi:hypothetical protein